MAACKLLLDVAFLTRVLGLGSMLLGAASAFVLIPVSTRLTKQHRHLQVELSEAQGALSNLLSEALRGLRQIRFSSTEKIWEKRILASRARVLEQIWSVGVTMALLALVAHLGPILLASVALSAHSLQAGSLSPSVAFASLSLFGTLHEIFRDLPIMAASMHKSWVACHQVDQYLQGYEQVETSTSSEVVCFENATLSWSSACRDQPLPVEAFELRNVNLAFPKGKLSVITGTTGSGKSLLIASILEEANLVSGRLGKPVPLAGISMNNGILPGTIALVSQPPWIENCTVKDNIVFGCKFDEVRYKQVLHACALERDLGDLCDGDLTKAGVNGSALSGGQRWRVALARALYSPAEILILEDILSALDAPVARWISNHALTGEMAARRTRILVTHHPEICLSSASYVVTVQNGTVHGSSKSATEMTTEHSASKEQPMSKPSDSSNGPAALTTIQSKSQKASRRNRWQICFSYLRASGGMQACSLGVLVTLGCKASSAGHSWWLARWTSNEEVDKESEISRNIGVYLGLSIVTGLALAIQSIVFTSIGLRASKSLFMGMVKSILTAPLRWVDNTPLGQILQSLGGDMYLIDSRMVSEMSGLLGCFSELAFIFMTR